MEESKSKIIETAYKVKNAISEVCAPVLDKLCYTDRGKCLLEKVAIGSLPKFIVIAEKIAVHYSSFSSINKLNTAAALATANIIISDVIEPNIKKTLVYNMGSLFNPLFFSSGN